MGYFITKSSRQQKQLLSILLSGQKTQYENKKIYNPFFFHDAWQINKIIIQTQGKCILQYFLFIFSSLGNQVKQAFQKEYGVLCQFATLKKKYEPYEHSYLPHITRKVIKLLLFLGRSNKGSQAYKLASYICHRCQVSQVGAGRGGLQLAPILNLNSQSILTKFPHREHVTFRLELGQPLINISAFVKQLHKWQISFNPLGHALDQ